MLDIFSCCSFAFATCSRKWKSTEGELFCGDTKKQKSLTDLDLSEFIREIGIKSYNELIAIAEE